MKEIKSILFWVAMFALIMIIWNVLSNGNKIQEVKLSVLTQKIENSEISEVEIHDDYILAISHKKAGNDSKNAASVSYRANLNPMLEGIVPTVTQLCDEKEVPYSGVKVSRLWSNIMVVAPIFLIIVLWFFIMKQFQGGSSKAFSFGKSKAKLATEGVKDITFDDVAGCQEAKAELEEIVDFLKNHKKYTRLGAKIPRGVLLCGAPGTGKTLLAKAVSGEAKVPFFSISGSDFVEMFVGVGASRVRDLFSNAKKHSPCLIFIDEIDAVGRQRFAGVGGGHDEREQTLNQLLVEMDGFNPKEGIIVIAATNRPDVLDPALLRPGRFDRRVMVDRPDVKGREAIFDVHLRKIKYDVDFVKTSVLARGTPGFTGADIANVVNEAALIAASKDKKLVEMADLEQAKDKVMMGPERRSMVLTEEEKRNTAVHEAGHTLVALCVDHSDPIHKVTIIPRGRALGVTAYLPEQEKKNYTKSYILSQIKVLFGGRAAEELIYNELSTGASNDLQRATDMAHSMICSWGMSSLGLRTFGKEGGEVFLGRDLVREKDFSESTGALIDNEIKAILDESYVKVLEILTERKEDLLKIADYLVERETLSGKEVDMVLAGEELPPLELETEKEEKKAPDSEAEDDSQEPKKTFTEAMAKASDEKTDTPSDNDNKDGDVDIHV